MSLAARLWAANRDLTAQARNGCFVRGIADGTLAPDVFAGYVAQDEHFLAAFARAYALALAASPDTATLLVFADLVAGVRDELAMHASYAGRGDAGPVGPAPATLAYTDFLLATAATAGLGVTCAAMTPCMRLYAHLGTALAAEGVTGPYASWVRTYADPAFGALADRLEALLDTHAVDGPPVRAAYRRAMQLEVAFFEAASDQGDVDRGPGVGPVAAEEGGRRTGPGAAAAERRLLS